MDVIEFSKDKAIREGKVIITEGFLRSLPIHDKDSMRECHKLIEKIYRLQTVERDYTKIGKLSQRGTKFHGVEKLYKFRSNRKNRIIYSYGREFENMPEEFSSSIVFIKYVREHDKQDLLARCISDKSDEDCILSLVDLDQKEIDSLKSYSTFDTEEIIKYHASSHLIVDEENFLKALGQKALLSPVLNNKQSNVVSKAALPMILMGCAGSGKTLIGIEVLHNRALGIASNERNVYFSLSNKLVNYSYDSYKSKAINEGFQEFLDLSEGHTVKIESNRASFYNLLEYCGNKLDKGISLINTYTLFKSQFFDREVNSKLKKALEKRNISSREIYQEIRGIIKGFLDRGYSWNRTVRQDELLSSMQGSNELQGYEDKRDLISELRREGYLLSCDNDERLIYLNLEKKVSDSRVQLFLEDIFLKFDISKLEISEEEYMNISREHSPLDLEKRSLVYRVYLVYKAWIERKDLRGRRERVDDNDLVYLAIEQGGWKKSKYDLIVVDEVQDFTEKQLYFIRGLARDPRSILYMGDVHQSITMSSFSEKRLGVPYKREGSTLNYEYLNKNYRSQKRITDLSNTISRIRSKYILSKSKETEIQQESISEGIKPFKLNMGEKHLREIVEKISSMANGMIILNSESEKDDFMEKYGIDRDDEINIFTSQEVKGLESDYVLCYNMLSPYTSDWLDIFEGKAKKNPKYNYIFNTFYVAITRASQFLYIYEDDKTHMEKALAEHFQNTTRYDEQDLFLDIEESDELRAKKARDLEYEGFYRKAANIFKMAGKYLDESRCLSKLYLLEGDDHERSLYHALVASDDDDNLFLFSEINMLSKHKPVKILASIFLGERDFEDQEIEGEGPDIRQYIESFGARYRCEQRVAKRMFMVGNKFADDARHILDEIKKKVGISL